VQCLQILLHVDSTFRHLEVISEFEIDIPTGNVYQCCLVLLIVFFLFPPFSLPPVSHPNMWDTGIVLYPFLNDPCVGSVMCPVGCWNM
jgi:hypothetical protein